MNWKPYLDFLEVYQVDFDYNFLDPLDKEYIFTARGRFKSVAVSFYLPFYFKYKDFIFKAAVSSEQGDSEYFITTIHARLISNTSGRPVFFELPFTLKEVSIIYAP